MQRFGDHILNVDAISHVYVTTDPSGAVLNVTVFYGTASVRLDNKDATDFLDVLGASKNSALPPAP
jgi:hypothetical protein